MTDLNGTTPDPPNEAQTFASPPNNNVVNDSSKMKPTRSGRVPKPKPIWDPTEKFCELRRQRRNLEAQKAQKLKESIAEESKELPKAQALFEMKSPHFPVVANSIGNKRRQTISTAVCENPCIVCDRSDTKKGRFVDCIGMNCFRRGNLSCLRSAKYFKAEDDEDHWRCPQCKICKNCSGTRNDVSKPLSKLYLLKLIQKKIFFCFHSQEQLYKCKSCYDVFHVACAKTNAKKVTKKHFLCGTCEKGEPSRKWSHRDEIERISYENTKKLKYESFYRTLERFCNKLPDDTVDNLHFKFLRMVQDEITEIKQNK